MQSHLGFDYVDRDSIIPYIINWVKSDGSFCWNRFNDGELNCMLGLAGPAQSSPGNTQYLPEIRTELIRVFDDIVERLIDGKIDRSRFLLGCFHHNEWWHPAVAAFHRWLECYPDLNWRKDIPWSEAEIWYNTAVEEAGNYGSEGIFDLLTSLRESNRKVVLVGNPQIENAKHCMDSDFVSIPRLKTWESSKATITQINNMISKYGEHVIFIWCGGFAAKIWMHDTWTAYPDTSHLDFGHFFDGAFGDLSRSWLRRENGPHRKFYVNRIAPWIRSFIKKNKA